MMIVHFYIYIESKTVMKRTYKLIPCNKYKGLHLFYQKEKERDEDT